MPEKRYVSVTTMAQMYELSKSFIRDHIRAGNLNATNISTNAVKPVWRISIEDADDFMDFRAHRAEMQERKLLTA